MNVLPRRLAVRVRWRTWPGEQPGRLSLFGGHTAWLSVQRQFTRPPSSCGSSRGPHRDKSGHMKRLIRIVAAVVLASSLLAGGEAAAQGRGHGGGHDRGGGWQGD